MSVQASLSRKSLGVVGLAVFGFAASAPAVVLVGSIPQTYGATGVVGVPLAFVLLAAIVALLAVGYTAVSRHVPHAAAFYAIIARGLGPSAGVAGGAVALLGYNAIQICQYGLLGATMNSLIGGPWWLWAYLALAAVAFLGLRPIVQSTRLLATVLFASLAVVLLFVIAALIDPAGGTVTFDGFDPAALFVSGIGGVFSLTIAAFIGVEAPGSFAEETQDKTAVNRAMFAGIAGLGLVYAAAAWASGVAVGPDQAGNPEAGLPFSVLEGMYGSLMTPMTQIILVAAIVTSLLAFHSVAARYAFAIAREGVLPARLATTGKGTRTDAPVGGSQLQTAVAAVVVGVFALTGADPIGTLFTWGATLAVVALLGLLIAAAIAAMSFFAKQPRPRESAWTRTFAPMLGTIFGTVVMITLLSNVDTLLGAGPDSLWPYLVPAAVVLVAIAGILRAATLRTTNRKIYDGISRGVPKKHAVPDHIPFADL